MTKEASAGLLRKMLSVFLLVSMVGHAGAQSPVIPDAIVSLGSSGDTRYVIVVEKSTQRLMVFACDSDGVRQVNSWPCSTGEVPGTKRESGDKKTPEGVYFLLDKYEDRDLTPIYGVMAYPLDYPNFLDQKAGKNGSAIWLHGTNKALKKNNTNGCIALENGDLKALSAYLSLNRTPLIIVAETGQWTTDDAVNAEKRVSDFIGRWSSALVGGDYHVYLDFYHVDFFPDMRWWETWREVCSGFQENVPSFGIVPREMSVYRHDGNYVVLLDQVLTAGSRETVVGKKKLFIAETGKDLSIIGETYHPYAEYSVASEKENLLIAASRRFENIVLAEQRIRDLLKRWVSAWEGMDIDAYGACYDAGFSLDGMNRRQWLAYKKRLNKQYAFIRIGISDLRFMEQSDRRGVVRFIQHYASDKYSDTGMKTLVLRQKDGEWAIYRESWEKLDRIPENHAVEQAER